MTWTKGYLYNSSATFMITKKVPDVWTGLVVTHANKFVNYMTQYSYDWTVAILYICTSCSWSLYKCIINVIPIRWMAIIVRRAGLLWSQQDFEWRWSVPLFKCLTVLEFSFILFDLCLLITFFNFIMNYVPIVTFWIFTYHKIWILSIMFCSIWSYWIIYFLACLEVSWRVVS